jgi:acetyl-CoA acetyltransferase
MSTPPTVRRAAITGTGHSDLHTRGAHSLPDLALQAVRRAVHDAGLAMDDIDGLATYGTPAFPTVRREGVNAVGVATMLRLLRPRQLRWYCEPATGLVMTSIVEAVNAIESGRCEAVVVWRAMALPDGRYAASRRTTATQDEAFSAPFGATSILAWHALMYARYRHLYGASELSLGRLVVASHRAAERNEHAVAVPRPAGPADYLASPVVAAPRRRLDCDRPVAGCAAVVVTGARAARDGPHRPAYVAGLVQNTRPADPALHYTLGDAYETGRAVGTALWDRSDVTPGTVGAAQLYDGFSPTVFSWLEALGFCARGEAHEWVGGVHDASRFPVPVNTFGGSLGEGRLHGMGHVIEAARQVSGRAGTRQVPGCRSCVVTIGSPLINGGALLLQDD